jgi:hypothetical protein
MIHILGDILAGIYLEKTLAYLGTKLKMEKKLSKITTLRKIKMD